MAKKSVKNLFVQIIVGANLVTVFLMILTGYSYLVNPLKFSIVSTWGLFFPFFLLLNLFFLVFWLFLYWRKAYVPVFALLVCYFPVRTYLGINVSKDVPEDAIKVMSYNVKGMQGYPETDLSRDTNSIARYIYDEDCGIVCLQESFNSWLTDSCWNHLIERYPYHQEDTKNDCLTRLAILSKYEIVESDTLRYESKSNFSMWYRLKVGEKDVYVVNNYLEISHLSLEDREQFSQMVKGDLKRDSAREESKSVIGKLTESALIRAPQAQAIAKFIDEHKGKTIIVMGDFNDNPISYTHYAISKNLTDCFVASGKGFGWSYCHNAMRVRIDNILCSKNCIPYDCQVDNRYVYSDHYPIKCWVKID